MSPERRPPHIRDPPTGSSERRSNGRACVTCHQRKIRCDILIKGTPCSNCQSQGHSSCRLYEKKKSRAAQARNARRNVPIQPRGQQVATAPTTPVDVVPQATPLSRQISQENSGPSLEDGSIQGQAGEESLQVSQRSVSESATSHDRESLDEQATRNLADFIDDGAVRVTEIGESHRLYFIGTEFSNLNYLLRQRSGHIVKDQLHFGSHHPARKVSRVPAEALELPEKPLADMLIQAYFTRVNPGWPIVDEVDFMDRYNSTDPKKSVPLPLLHSVFLVGAHVLASQNNDYKSLKSRFFRRAKLLIDARFEEDRKLYVQVALLMTWNCDNLEDIVSNSWYWIGFAARTALGLGMHRDVSQSRLSPVTKREWIRLWWVLFQLDLLISIAYGRPPAIRLDESDTPFLQECHFEGIPSANISFIIEQTRLCKIFSKAMSRVLALRSSPAEKAEARRQADESLAQYITQLPECLRLPQLQADIWQSYLHLTYNNFLILLHRPPAQPNASLHLSDYASDLNICGDAVVVITSIFESVRANSAMGELALPTMYTMLTALVHVSSELKSASPLVAAKSMRMFDSLLISLRDLSNHWLYGRSLLKLFGERSMWDSRRRHQDYRSSGASPMDAEHRRFDGSHGEGGEFSLRPNPLTMPTGIGLNPVEGSNVTLTPSSMVSGQGSMYTGQVHTGIHMNPEAGTESGDRLPGPQRPYDEGFDNSSFVMPPEGLDMIPFPLALDFLLAGMGNEYECL
ncbi:fungal-specific transcription factor domain-containing protein [Mariannaea sp. PMI_226]|nr:fungal-specific transcription factor domain-containing protein [Mariannaea sp. PMI_226]